MPNLLLLISGACIVAYVLRETLLTCKRKKTTMTGIMIVWVSRAN